jgi:N-acetylglucosamine kinase-like BadF-type ATPase
VNFVNAQSQTSKPRSSGLTPSLVLGIDAGGSKTVALLADVSGSVIGRAEAGGANLRVHGELEVEKVLFGLLEKLPPEARRAEALAIGIAGADRPEDEHVLRAILARLGFRERVVVTNDARIAFVAGSPSRVGLALVCGTGSIAWGRNASGDVARAGGWGWHLGDEGSGFWIGVRAVREALRAEDGRGPATRLQESLIAHFEIARPEQILRAVYDGEFPRHRVAAFAVRVEEAALAGDEAARSILAAAANELVLAAASVRERLHLASDSYDVVLSGGTFQAVPTLEDAVAGRLAAAPARIVRLREEPATGAVRLAVEALSSGPF